MANDTRTVYFAAFCDDPCGHAHKSFEQAEKCAAKTTRRAKQGQRFHNSDLIAKWARQGSEAASFVKSRVYSR